MIEIGRLCMKLAGRDAGKKCVVVDILDAQTVLIDGETRRRKCNIIHLEPLRQTINVSKGASHDVVIKAFKSELKIDIKVSKKKEAKPRPRKVRKKKVKPLKKKAAGKKVTEKKESVKKEAEEKKAEPQKVVAQTV